MENKNNNKELIREIKNACRVLGDINVWLPRAIDDALHGHRGTLDRVDIDRMTEERKEDDKRNTEINSLQMQVQETQNQTKEIQKQTKYLFWAFVITIIGTFLDIILRIFKVI